jgi:hypothetical protein
MAASRLASLLTAVRISPFGGWNQSAVAWASVRECHPSERQSWRIERSV